MSAASQPPCSPTNRDPLEDHIPYKSKAPQRRENMSLGAFPRSIGRDVGLVLLRVNCYSCRELWHPWPLFLPRPVRCLGGRIVCEVAPGWEPGHRIASAKERKLCRKQSAQRVNRALSRVPVEFLGLEDGPAQASTSFSPQAP